VAEFGGRDDAVQRGEVALELDPGTAAAAGGIGGVGVFEDDAFVAARAGVAEGGGDGGLV
jgi:hypothetical protein